MLKKLNFLSYSITDAKNNVRYYVTLKYSQKHNKLLPVEVVFEYKDDPEAFETTEDLVSEYIDIDKKLVKEIDKTLDMLWNKKIDPNELNILF